nr:GGDEF domain-containing protein [Leptospira yasudae]
MKVGDCVGESYLIDEKGKVAAKITDINLGDLPEQIPKDSFERLSIKDNHIWIYYNVVQGELDLVHKISIVEFVIFCIQSLIPYWILIFTTAVLILLYFKLRISMKQVSRLINMDPLTGISNRRGFLSITQRLLAIGNRQDRPWSLMMVDIDHFKSVNDKFGHDAGDHVLVKVAKILDSSIRGTDAVCRWGGEEFALFFLDAELKSSISIAEHLRHEVEQKVFLKDGSSVTLSIGVSQGKVGGTLEEARHKADQALYRAKIQGRNRVCFEMN